MIKAVFFDLYNTLVRYDPPREEVQAAVLGGMGIEVRPEALRYPLSRADDFWYRENARLPVSKRPPEERMSLYTDYQMIILQGTGIEIGRELAQQIGLKVYQVPTQVVLFDDVLPTIAELRGKGLTLGLISNIDGRLWSRMQGLDLLSRLDVVATSRDVGVEKPAPKIFLTALELAGVEASQAIHVGDQYHSDVVGARGVGIKPVLLDRWGFYGEITDCPRIHSLTQVVEHL